MSSASCFRLACLLGLIILIHGSAIPSTSSSVPSTFDPEMSKLTEQSAPLFQEAFADGLHAEVIPPVLVEGRELALFVKMQPTYIAENARPNVSLEVRLFESQTNQTVTNVTYVIFVGKFDPGSEQGARPLLVDMFYSTKGPLTLNIIPTDRDLRVNASKSQYADAWLADESTGAIDYGTPILFEGGLYYVGVIIAGVEGPDRFFPPGSAPSFEAGLSIGYTADYNIQYSNQKYNVTLISYYDKINSFEFDPSSMTLSWSMPFDWRSERIENNSGNIFVHQEIKIPKTLQEMLQDVSFEGTVNGVPLLKGKIVLDPFSFEDYMTIHYIFSKSDIVAMSREIDSEDSEMSFTLSPSKEDNLLQHTRANSQTVLVTEGSGIQITADWAPSESESDVAGSQMMLTFYDMSSAEAIKSDILYDMTIRDMQQRVLFSGRDLVAKNGTDSQLVNFPPSDDDTYYIEIRITGFLLESNNEASQQSLILDESRAGIARGVVVVPEFPYPILLASAALGTLIAMLRQRTLRSA